MGGQTIGDAVLRFLGDSTDLDTKFDKVGPDAEKAFGKAADAVEEGTGRMKSSMGEARGEAALLGEAFGVHLPRHVRSFVAELPGVNQALSAAFSATAVLFLLNAVVELSKKISEAITEFTFSKSALEEQQKSVVELNAVLVGLSKEYETLKKKADDYGKSAIELANASRGQVKQSVAELTKELADEEKQFVSLQRAQAAHAKSTLSISDAYTQWRAGNISVGDAIKGYIGILDTSTLKAKENSEVQNKVLETAAKLKNAQQELRVATNSVSTAQEDLNKKGAALEEQLSKTYNTINDLNRALNHTKAEVSNIDIVTPSQVKNLLMGVDAAHRFSVTLKSDLVQALTDAKKAEQDFVASGIQDGVARKQLAAEVDKARLALENYGATEDKFKTKSHGLWKQFRDDAKDGATSLDQMKQIGVTAFDDVSKGMESAIQQAILSQANFGQALEKATAQALASLASQALVKALFYTAEGFAALASWNDSSAMQYFTAAGEMAAVGGAAGVAAHALAGGGSSSSTASTTQNNSNQSNTSSQSRGGGSSVGVQHFATGGLITAPTLAVMGEQSRREAVLPLEDPQAMGVVGKSIAAAGGGGGITVHVHGHVIGANDVAHLTDQISKRVNRGQATLLASHSLRVTKRSA